MKNCNTQRFRVRTRQNKLTDKIITLYYIVCSHVLTADYLYDKSTMQLSAAAGEKIYIF